MMLIMCLEYEMNSHLMVTFGIGRHLCDISFRLTFILTQFLNSEGVFLMLYAQFSVLDNLICSALTLSDICQYF